MSNVLYGIALTLVVIGAINWGAYAMKFNLVEKLLGGIPYAEKTVYFLVALCGLYVSIATISSPSQYIRRFVGIGRLGNNNTNNNTTPKIK